MNILILTTIYRDPEDSREAETTPVVQNFAREWVKQGHSVIAIVNSSRFPLVCYWGVDLVKPFLMKKYNIIESNLSSRTWAKPFDFEDEGVAVYNRPMLKYVPSGNYTESRCRRQVGEIIAILERHDFQPDVITGHWLNPQLRLISMLVDHYHCRSAFVFHSEVTADYIKKYHVEQYIRNIDRIGCRSKTNADILKENLKLPYDPFVCPSGIPDRYILDMQAFDHEIRSGELQLLSAGRLVNYKRMDAVIAACAKFKANEIAQLTIVGEGPLKKELEACAGSCNLSERVLFTGRIERDALIKRMRQSDIFVLISEREVFGLVYLEAMLQGCIVIAAKGGGVDGIIVDGVNGFLCEQGNAEALAKILSQILHMSVAEKQAISRNAAATASQYSDSQIAARYLATITE